MRQLTLEEEVQQRCEEKSPSEATEDPGPGGLHVDPMDSKTLQGTALGVEGPLSRRRRLTCAVLLLTRPLGGRETPWLWSGRCPALCCLTSESFPHESRFPRSLWAQLHSRSGFLQL